MKASQDVVPFLNVTTRIEGKAEDDLLQKMGGRGFPYCVLMDAKGEVLWEVRPTSQEDFAEGVSQAKKLDGLKKKLAASPEDAALQASVNLFDAMGRGQREAPPVEKLEEWAKVEGIDPEVKSKIAEYMVGVRIQAGMKVQSREEAMGNMYALLKEGVKPAADSQVAINYYYLGMLGALEAKDAKLAKVGLEGFQAAAKNLPERFRDRVQKDVEKYSAQIKELEGAAEGDGDSDDGK